MMEVALQLCLTLCLPTPQAIVPVVQNAFEHLDKWEDSPVALSTSSSTASLPSKRYLQEGSVLFSNKSPTSSSPSFNENSKSTKFTGTSYYTQEHLKNILTSDTTNLDKALLNALSNKDLNSRSFYAAFSGSSGPGNSRGGYGHHHRRGRSSSSLRRYGGRRLQLSVPDDTCDRGCDDFADANSRLICNCNDLTACVRDLTVNDFAVMFSRGLSRDEETGIIDQEQVFDLFDASNLLDKIEDIRTQLTATEGSPDEASCSALIDYFHVPCKDWEDGCISSSGSSYRMVGLRDSFYNFAFFICSNLQFAF